MIKTGADTSAKDIHGHSTVTTTIENDRLVDLFFKDPHTCFALMDKDFDFVRVNEAYAKAGGHPADYFVGKNYFDLFPKEALSVFEQVKKTGESFKVSERPVIDSTPEENTKFWDWQLDPVLGDDGTVEFLAFYLKEVTQRVRIEKEQQRFVSLSGYMASTSTFDGYFVELSPGWNKTLGFSNEELMAKPYVEFVHPEDVEKTLEEAKRLAADTGETVNFVNRYQTKYSGYRWLSWNAVSDFQMKLVYAVAHDITPLKDSEAMLQQHRDSLEEIIQQRTEALKLSESRLSTLVNSGPAVIYTCEASGDYGATFVSDNLELTFGYKSEQFTSDPGFWASNIHPEDAERVFADLPHLFETGYHTHEYRFKSASGDYIWVHDQCRLLYDDNGKPLEIAGYWANITERKQVEQELENAKAMAEQGNRSKSNFLSRMSHELRTPLNAILGFSQLIMMGSKSEEEKQNINEVIKAGNHLLELINDVLDLSKIESGKLPISMENINLNQVLQDCFTLIAPLAFRRKITIEDNISTDTLFIVWADYTRLKQVLLNLLSNAVKYNRPAGKIILDVKPLPDGQIRISISDTGYGIKPDLQNKLFISFERLGAESTDIEGSGIGLVISKQLIEIMGGDIGFESTSDNGSVFWIDVYLGDVLSQNNRTGTLLKNITVSQEELDVDCKTILYVEDNPANLRLVNKILSGTPHKLISAHNGSLGLELAELHKPDLILLDINLPIMNGFDVIRKIKENQELHHIPVVAISANAMNRDVERGLAAGFDRYLKKPLDIREFMSTIETLV